MKTANNKRNEKYPCVFKLDVSGEPLKAVPGKSRGNYTGILFNGDCKVYCKATVRALKAIKADRALIKAVKSAKGDLEISRLLIEANQFDVLVEVFNVTDAHTAINDYIDYGYEAIVAEFSGYAKNYKPHIDTDKASDIIALIKSIDDEIKEKSAKACDELKKFHLEVAKPIIDKYHVACIKMIARLEEEAQTYRKEIEELEKLLS